MRYNLIDPVPKVVLPPELPFGRVSTNHMAVCDFKAGSGWGDLRIEPLTDFVMPPSSIALHYGQQIFEGLKAYRGDNDSIYLFRPDANARRFSRSASRLAMEPVPETMFLEAVTEIVRVERDWVPKSPGSLYIRPMLIPMDAGASYRAGEAYKFCVFVAPVGDYYRNSGLTVAVERMLSRAAPGGVGEAKCGGNYASALLGVRRAKAAGADDVIWLDACSQKFVEEVGTMNLFFVEDKKLRTPALSGSILPGITRASLLQLAAKNGFEAVEERLEIDAILQGIRTGRITEVFGCGTAAVISNIKAIIDGDDRYELPDVSLSIAKALRQNLMDLQFGRAPDSSGWRLQI